MNKQTKGKRIGGSGGGVDGDIQLGTTKSSQSMKNIGECKKEQQKSRSDNTPNPRVG
jgi:hypothetical protein